MGKSTNTVNGSPSFDQLFDQAVGKGEDVMTVNPKDKSVQKVTSSKQFNDLFDQAVKKKDEQPSSQGAGENSPTGTQSTSPSSFNSGLAAAGAIGLNKPSTIESRAVIPNETSSPQINLDSEDPIGEATFPLQQEKQNILNRNIGAASTFVKKPFIEKMDAINADQQQLRDIDKQIGEVHKAVIPDAITAKNYIQRKLALKDVKLMPKNGQQVGPNGLEAPTDPVNVGTQDLDNFKLEDIKNSLDPTATNDVAFQKYQRFKNIKDAIATSGTLDEAGIKYAASQNPQIKAQVDLLGGATDNLPNAFAGHLVNNFLNDPDVVKAAQLDPALKQKWQEANDNLYNQYPDFAKTKVSQIISQAREDRGLNSGFINIPNKENTDKLMQDLKNEGKVSLRDMEVYQKEIRPYLGFWRSVGRGAGRLVAPALVNESPISTPDIGSTFEDSYVNTLRGVAHSIEDLTYRAGGLVPDNRNDQEQRVKDLLQHDYSQVQIDPKGMWHNITSSTGNITGFVLPMILGGEAGGMANLGKGSSEMLTNGLMFEGNNSDKSATMFPGSSAKQFMYTTAATAGDMLLGKLLEPREKADAIRNLLKPEITKAIENFTSGKIAAAEVKQGLLQKTKQFIADKAPEFIKGDLKMGAVMSGFNMFHNGLDAAFGGRDVKFDDAANEALNTFKTGMLGGLFLSGVQAAGKNDNTQLTGKVLRELATNPEFFTKVIEDGAKLSPALDATKNERIANLNEAAAINAEINKTQLTEPQKQKYLLAAMKEKIFQRNAENATDGIIKADYEQKAAEANLMKQAIYKGEDKAPEFTSSRISVIRPEDNKKPDIVPLKKNSVPQSENIVPDASLRTMNLGKWEGTKEDDEAKQQFANVVDKRDVKAGETGETFDEFLTRVIPKADEVLKTGEPNTAIMTHSSVLKAIKLWDDMGRPALDDILKGGKLEKEYSEKYNSAETTNGEVETLNGDNGEIHIVRHGQTKDNEENNFRSGDTPLTQKGIDQAKESGKVLKARTGGQVPKIITSDLPRTVHSSNLIEDALKPEKQKPLVNVIRPEDNTEPNVLPLKGGEGTETAKTPEDVLTDAAKEKRIPGIEGEMLANGQITPEQAMLEFAKQMYGISDSGDEVGSGRKMTGMDTDVLDAIQQKFPDKQSVIDAIKGTGTTPPDDFGNSLINGNGETVGITHEQTSKIADELGLPQYQKTPEKVTDWDAEADKEIKNGYDINRLLTEMEHGRQPDAVETRIIGKYVAYLKDVIAKDPSNANLDKMARVIDVSDKVGGTDPARTLRARQGTQLVGDSLAGFFMEDLTANNDAPLTDKQKETVEKEYNDISEKEKAYQDKIAELEKENAKLKAQKAVRKSGGGGGGTTTKTHEDFVKERDDIIEHMRAQLKKARGETTATIVPYAKELVAIAPDVFKLAKSLLEEGAIKFEELVNRLHDHIKEIVPEATHKDVVDILAGEHTEKKPPRSELMQRLYDVRSQAQLLNKYEDLLNEEPPTNEKQLVRHNQELEGLRKKVSDLKSKTPTADELKDLRDKYFNERRAIEQKLEAGDYSEPEKKVGVLDNPDSKKNFPELYKQAKKAQSDLNKARDERRLRLAVKSYDDRTALQKLKDKAIRILNVPRTVMASMDFSAPLRQGIIVAVNHPIMAAEAQMAAFKAAFKPKYFDQWFHDMKENPRYEIATNGAGLDLTDPHSLHLRAQEEAFMGNIAEKLPIVGGGTIKIGGKEIPRGLDLIGGSERAYVLFLDKMRWDLFNRYADQFEENGRTFQNSPALYKGLASYINNATGRGNLGFAEAAAPVLNSILFSPRLIASRLNMLGFGKFYWTAPKEIRNMAIKDMIKFISAGAGVLALAHYGFGLQTETDPRSSDFGKIRDGDTRWDIWGGFQPYIRIIAQELSGERKNPETGETVDLHGKGRLDALTRFGRGKLAPVPAMGVDFLSGQQASGDQTTVKQEILDHFTPLLYSDIHDAWKDQGMKALFTAGIPSVFGIGVQTYKPSGGGGRYGGGGSAGSY